MKLKYLIAVIGLTIFESAVSRPMSSVDLVELARIDSPVLSPDGRYLLYLRSEVNWDENKEVDRYRLINISSGEERRVPEAEEPKDDFDAAVWSPRGNGFVTAAKRADDEHDQAYFFDVGDGQFTRLTNHPEDVDDIVWAPDGDGFYYSSEAPLDVETERLLDDDWLIADYEFRQAKEVWYFDFESGDSRTIIAGTFSVRNFSLSRDGGSIIYTHALHGLADRPDSELWVHDVATGRARQATHNQYAEGKPKLSPDGDSFAYIASVDEAGDQYYEDNLFVQRIGDRRPQLILPNMAMEILDFSWDNNGAGLFILGNTGVRSNLYHFNIENGTLTSVTSGDVVVDEWTFDALLDRHVFILGSQTNPGEVFVLKNGNAEVRQLTNEYANFAETFTLPNQSVFSWIGQDGTELEGLLVLPIGYQSDEPFPLVTITHGGPRSSAQFGSWNLSRYLPVLAGEGYGVFLPNHRGGAGYGDDFLRDMVGGYFRSAHLDVLNGIDALIEKGLADPDQLIKMGWSAGGHMTNKLITTTDRFRAASSGAGVSDWVSLYGESDIRHNRTPWFGGAPWQKDAPLDSYQAQSLLKDTWRIRTPTLFFVGADDKRVPPTQAIMMYRGAKAAGAETRLYVAPDQPHNYSTPKYRLFKINTELEWYSRHLDRERYTPRMPALLEAEAP